MKQYDRFIFDSYVFDREAQRIELNYSLDDDVRFTETIAFPRTTTFDIRDPAALERALFALHLIGGISYFKTCCPKTIEVQSGVLSTPQANFWSMVYEKGLGEFFFRNRDRISYTTGMIRFPSNPDLKAPDVRAHGLPQHTLIPVGGGKDSIVTIERTSGNATLFRIGGHPVIDRVAAIAGKPLLTIDRRLSPALFALNEQGALNGHVPITAYVSVVSVVTALLYGFTKVLMSNEQSADEGNLQLDGLDVNHQWSKSRAFEEAFSDYLRTWVTKDVLYESALRDMTELEVVGAFSRYPQYFHDFTSCNKNWKILKDTKCEMRDARSEGLWCGRCPKCAFVFALLAAHLSRETVLTIFGKNLFEDETLWPLYEELLGHRGHKPFECVGTPVETTEAFRMAHEKKEWDDTTIMKLFLQAAS